MGWAGHGVPEIGGYPIPISYGLLMHGKSQKIEELVPRIGLRWPWMAIPITGRDHIVDIYGLGRCIVSHMLELFCIISQVGLMEMI
jgi:hypothetical protein